MRVQLRKSVVEFIQNTASYVETSEGTFYFIPFYFQRVEEDDTFEEYTIDKLPEIARDAIRKLMVKQETILIKRFDALEELKKPKLK